MIFLMLSVAAFAPFFMFVVGYLFYPWYRNPAGRSVMLLAVVCTLALAPSVWRQVAEEAPPEWFRLAIFLLVIVAGWWQLGTFIYVVRRDRRRERESS